jgi:V8-like Glu-specific endopeptidase
MKKFFAILLLLLLPTTSKAKLEDVGNATCKVYSDSGTGSGVVFLENETDYFVLTAGHIVYLPDGSLDKTIELEFFIDGFKSKKITSNVDYALLVSGTTIDLAVLKFPKMAMTGYKKPNVIPIDSTFNAKPKDVILTYGCPAGRWPSGQKGHVLHYHPDRLIVTPNPIGGRSGSGVFDEKGEKIIGIIIWKDGTAVPSAKIKRLLTGS